MNNIDWLNILINTSISLFLSIILFSLGLRAGKERTERLKLREKYREIYSYFYKFREGIDNCKPLYWKNFVKSLHDKFTPYCKEMMDNGKHLELRKEFFPKLSELEKECLKYGWNFYKLSVDAGELVLKILEKHNINLIKDSYSIKTKIDESEDHGSFFEYNPARLICEKQLDEMLSRIKDGSAGVTFTYVDQSKIKYAITIRQKDIKHIDIKGILTDIRDLLLVNQTEILNTKEKLLNNIDYELKRLGKRIKEHYSFWDTLINSFKDLLR